MSIDSLFERWGKLPTTQARITVTLICMVGTTVVYCALAIWAVLHAAAAWEPSWQWLGFLVAMSGLDVSQYIGKRTTDAGYVAAKQGTPAPIPPTDPVTTQ